MLKVISAHHDTGCYRLYSSLTNRLYDVLFYDGIYDKTNETMVASPVSFTVRGCINQGAAIQKIKRYLTKYEKTIITIKEKENC